MKRVLNWKTASGAIAILGSLAARAQQPVLTGDAEINSAATTTNYGTATTMTVSSTKSALLQFNLADILPTGITPDSVLKARLIVYPDAIATAGTVDLYEVTGAWSEGSVTYATKPTIASSAAASTSFTAANLFQEFTVTGVVRDWITTPSSDFGIELKAVGSTNLTLDSKENTATSHPAVLELIMSGPAGPAGATGASGPQGPKGATGATGPQGPAGGLTLPYTAYASDASEYLITVENTGASGGGISVQGGDGTSGGGGAAIFAEGGLATMESQIAGIGVWAIGGDGTTSDTHGGNGGVFYGGSVSTSESGGFGGEGVEAQGGSGSEPGYGGYGIVASPGSNGEYAGVFEGNVYVNGSLSKSGGSFKIDDPIDPANQYLYHSFVESPDMMNIYNGNVVTDGSGTATVALPDYFEALNSNYRYQLTVIGQFAQAIVASKISGNRFTIKTDKPNVEVSWQVTGIRQDAWANAHRIPNEVDKSDIEKGHYLHPELFGHAGEQTVEEVTHPHRHQVRPQ